MASFTLSNRFKPHQNKHTKAKLLLLLIALLFSSSRPHPALAFEAELVNAKNSAGQFVAKVQVFQVKEEGTLELVPDYSSRLASVALAPMTVITEESKLAPPMIARRARKQAAPKPLPALPKDGNPVVLEGEASYYSRAGCLGCSPALTMANGQPLNDNALTMAIGADKSYLVGRQAKVTNLATGLSTAVRITDTGGFYQAKYGNRVADLTIATKQAIGMNGGVGQVRVEVY